jgi:hypothetical protein
MLLISHGLPPWLVLTRNLDLSAFREGAKRQMPAKRVGGEYVSKFTD